MTRVLPLLLGAALQWIAAMPLVAHASPPPSPLSPIAGAEQLLVVTTPDFSSTTGTLVRLERRGAKWVHVGAPIAVVVGKAGLGWGRGRFPSRDAALPPGPVKREGDKRAPAGVFTLGEVTGYAATAARGLKLPYREATTRLRCVDDPKAAEYNRFALAPEAGAATWSSDERMRRDDGLYELTLFVEHNSEQPVPGGGSCIFLHVSRSGDGPARPTVGCTAMGLAELTEVLVWLDPAKHPLLVQLPARTYRSIGRRLGLPSL